jgi:hypothetical protein
VNGLMAPDPSHSKTNKLAPQEVGGGVLGADDLPSRHDASPTRHRSKRSITGYVPVDDCTGSGQNIQLSKMRVGKLEKWEGVNGTWRIIARQGA